ncbi:NUDIX hydrolase [Sporolactobacillus pectinivorans]|uniref:NUDIX hydrolase n=1 Tax=Sporolactobacillus pectinivorans TaxID=1591408 RepID=UPI000C25A7B0|nr:NUDIX domain-containing protein [Sporolactobacillus pectinivorans]
MSDEKLKAFNVGGGFIGIKSRKEIHEKGYWHETFHCWFVEKNTEGGWFIYFQQRCHEKRDFPDLYDITAAGYIKCDESDREGIREVREELGIPIEIDDLISLGIVKDEMITSNFIDREFCHIYIYVNHFQIKDFKFQEEEVSGLYKISLSEFKTHLSNHTDFIKASGFDETRSQKKAVEKLISINEWVPHSQEYVTQIIKRIEKKLQEL